MIFLYCNTNMNTISIVFKSSSIDYDHFYILSVTPLFKNTSDYYSFYSLKKKIVSWFNTV